MLFTRGEVEVFADRCHNRRQGSVGAADGEEAAFCWVAGTKTRATRERRQTHGWVDLEGGSEKGEQMWKADSEMVQNIQRWEYEGGRIVRRPENSPQIKKQHDADSPQREPVKRGETNRIMQLATRPHPMEAHRANRPSGPAPGEAALQGQRRAHDFIVVAMDFSEAANRALEIALRHAKWLNSPVLLVHVIENGYAEGFLENHRKEHLRAKTYATAEKKLKDLVATRRRRGVPIFFEIRSGLPDYELLEAAQSAQAKMIVLGRPRRSALARVLLGSVSENVVDASPIPILIVPASL